jgi:stage V sporulation protein SpoVS
MNSKNPSEVEEIKVSSTSDVTQLSSLVAAVLQAQGKAQLACIGQSAVNQAVKGIIRSARMLSMTGHYATTQMFMEDRNLGDNATKSVVLLKVKRHNCGESDG